MKKRLAPPNKRRSEVESRPGFSAMHKRSRCSSVREPPENGDRVARMNWLRERLLMPDTLPAKLGLIAQEVVDIFGSDFARIWMVGPGDSCAQGCFHAAAPQAEHACSSRERCLHLVASAGRYTHLDGPKHRRVPLGAYKIGRVASGQDARFITNQAATDPRVHDHAWVRQLGLVAFAGYRLLSSAGTPVGVLALFSRRPIGNQDDALLQSVADTTAHVLQTAMAEEALRAKTEELDLYFNSTLDLLSIASLDGHFHRVNPQWHATLGYREEEVVGHHFSEFLHPEDIPGALQTLRSLVEKHEGVCHVNRTRCRDGSYRWLEWRASTCGALAYAVARDVTERRRVERQLVESEAKYRGVFDASGEGLLVVEQETGRVLDANTAAVALYGYQREELRAMNLDEVTAEPETTRDKLRVTDATSARHRRKDGSIFPVELTSSTTSMGGRPVTIIGVRDVTERQKADQERLYLERKVQQAQKLESLGVMAGGIAHDFNNLLTAILGNVGLALASASPDAPLREELLEAEKATKRAADLARQMLAYSGHGQLSVQRVDLPRLVRDMGAMLQVSVSSKAELRLDLPGSVPPIDADAAQLRQVLMNLVINASEAISEGRGTVSVSVGTAYRDPSALAEGWNRDPLVPGEYVYLQVVDTGSGIPGELQSRVFDPFYTTKFTGRGLGLAVVSGIVRGHRGTIELQSEVGKGTSVRVLIPSASRRAQSVAHASSRDPAQESGTVLLVDDEDGVRMVAAKMLQKLGFRVLDASDGRKALDTYRAHQHEISCVLLDLTLPYLNGEEVLAALRELSPDVPVILSTGYSEQDVVRRFAGKKLTGFVQKPYTLATLQRALQSALQV